MSAPDHSVRLLVASPGVELSPSERKALDLLAVGGEALDPSALPDSLPEGGGWLVLPSKTSPERLGEVVSSLGRIGDPWALLWLEPLEGSEVEDAGESGEDEGQVRIRVLPISLGYPEDLDQVSRRLESTGMDSGYLSHRKVLLDLSKVRHDVNNALTSALAETQFMQMDNEPGTELAEGLALVETQLRKIRDLMVELTVLRVSSR